MIISYNFTCLPTEGAALILPDGAVRKDIRFRREIFKFAKKHGVSWFKHVHETLGLLEDDAEPLYLVTGVDKCSNWCLASYSDIVRDAGMTLRFTPTELTANPAIRPYSCSRSGPITPRICPSFTDDGTKNQTVFIRGYRMLWRQNLPDPFQVTDIRTSNTVNESHGGKNPTSQAGSGFSTQSFGGTSGEGQPQQGEPGPGTDGVIMESFPTLSKVAGFVF
jgi:hypothetical protein